VAFAQYPHRDPGNRHELAQDSAEMRADRRELEELQRLISEFDDARARYDSALSALDSKLESHVRRELQDSRQEVRRERAKGDHREAAAERAGLERRRQIARELSPLFGKRDLASLSRKRSLMDELVRLETQELHQDAREIRNDRRGY
jgi:hypothetical protein